MDGMGSLGDDDLYFVVFSSRICNNLNSVYILGDFCVSSFSHSNHDAFLLVWPLPSILPLLTVAPRSPLIQQTNETTSEEREHAEPRPTLDPTSPPRRRIGPTLSRRRREPVQRKERTHRHVRIPQTPCYLGILLYNPLSMSSEQIPRRPASLILSIHFASSPKSSPGIAQWATIA
jgi:hypothetical protein